MEGDHILHNIQLEKVSGEFNNGNHKFIVDQYFSMFSDNVNINKWFVG